MKKFTKEVKQTRSREVTKAHENYMGGVSYGLNPLDTLKLIAASSIFGEPQYYRDGANREKTYTVNPLFELYSCIDPGYYYGLNTSEIMEKAIDDALSYDFEGTLYLARDLRKSYYMRLNPQIIMVRAAMHPGRVEFNKKHGNLFSKINAEVMKRADEPAVQASYYIYRNEKKNNLPGVLKRNWAERLERASKYEISKYKNSELGMINVIRLSHASGKVNPAIDELMRTGTVEVNEELSTWEREKSAGKSWAYILSSNVKLGHMALLRNLRGIFTEINNTTICRMVLEELKKGVPTGMQFPFRYYSAYKMISKSEDVHHKPQILDALEECIDISCNNMPKLKGKTMCLSDNSGSAWGAFPSEYGTVRVAEIGNLSSIIAARNSDEGYVGLFGDRLNTVPISKYSPLKTLEDLNIKGNAVGGATENGIWTFFDDAIRNKEWWDNIFIYSDQQAGHGGLYGTNKSIIRYKTLGFCHGGMYVDVAKLIARYRSDVNKNVNVFSIQTAGYGDAVVPEYGYRTNILTGWTGKELIFADQMIKFWDEKDSNN